MTKTFLNDIILNNLSQGLQFGSRWILNIALIAVLDIEAYALFSFTYSLSNILLSVLPFGSSTYLIAIGNKSTIGVKSLYQSNVIITAIFGLLVVVYLVLTPFLNTITGWNFAIYGIILSYMLSLNLVTFSYFKGIGQFNQELKAYSIFGVGLLMFTGYSYFIVKTLADIRIIFWVLIVLNTIILGYSYLFSELKKNISLSRESLKNEFRNIVYGLRQRRYFGYQDIVTAIYTQAGLLILFYIIDEKTYGYYRALFVIVAPIFMVTVAISQVILKHLVNTKSENVLNLFRKIQRYSILIGGVMCVVLVFIREFVFSFINIEVNRISIISYLIIVAITFMRFVFSNYEMLLVVYDMQKQRFFIMAMAAAISIISIFLLLPRFGLVGAVSTNAISYTIVLLGLVIITELKIRKLYK